MRRPGRCSRSSWSRACWSACERCVGVLVALPISKLLSDARGDSAPTPLSYAFSMLVCCSGSASRCPRRSGKLPPAWSAARVTVRDVLAYE